MASLGNEHILAFLFIYFDTLLKSKYLVIIVVIVIQSPSIRCHLKRVIIRVAEIWLWSLWCLPFNHTQYAPKDSTEKIGNRSACIMAYTIIFRSHWNIKCRATCSVPHNPQCRDSSGTHAVQCFRLPSLRWRLLAYERRYQQILPLPEIQMHLKGLCPSFLQLEYPPQHYGKGGHF